MAFVPTEHKYVTFAIAHERSNPTELKFTMVPFKNSRRIIIMNKVRNTGMVASWRTNPFFENAIDGVEIR